jgi:hypothetical protein
MVKLVTWSWATEPEKFGQFNRPHSELHVRFREPVGWFFVIRRILSEGSLRYSIEYYDDHHNQKKLGLRTCKEAADIVRGVIGEVLAKEFAGAE